MSTPFFWSQPFRYMRWASHAKPAIFYSIIIGLTGPVLVATVPSIRHRFGDNERPLIPMTYPVPAGPRKIPEGFDD
ncbi:NADH-ubiquinone oxidoreductase 9.5 kDa subunit [Tothia fuscella]|uniref:NADH-ubiquinone oxidoreductase 9.5 kDa subunit n=1 Tax=Tothia fuscella TaxID=1048955 RepID=A0A9P4NTD9_9PEZI|nr:NADH-ubiquinone oxidoreductase 9.5 kDa subunit [Tothia fuscella]